MPRTPLGADRESDTDARWVKVFAIVAIAVVVLFVVVHLTGLAGEGMHGHSSFGITEHSIQQP